MTFFWQIPLALQRRSWTSSRRTRSGQAPRTAILSPRHRCIVEEIFVRRVRMGLPWSIKYFRASISITPLLSYEDQQKLIHIYIYIYIPPHSGTITDILAFLAISPATSELILSVRGTTSLTNWLDDVLWARAATSLCSGCEAHLGFLTAYSELVAAINASLVTALARYPSYRIVVTGHSLGGAVATLLALHLRDALRGLLLLLDPGRGGGIALYTYGSPRVGNRALAAYVTQQQSGTASGGNYRVTHAADGVPRVPPAIADYRHVAPEYWLTPGPDGRTVYDPRLVAVCKGYASGRCNAGTPWWEVDIPSHLYYLVAISRCGEGGGGEEEEEEEIGATLGFSAAGRLSFDGGGGGGREGGGGYQYNGGIMGNENGNGNGTGPLGPVNGTTATNSTNATVDGLLTPATTNTLAMYAKLDQEFMAALEETGPGGDVAKPVF